MRAKTVIAPVLILFVLGGSVAADEPVKANYLKVGTVLGVGESIKSPNGQFVLTMQKSDGNAVWYSGTTPLWCSSTDQKGNRLTVTKEGQVVVYSFAEGKPSPNWVSRTSGENVTLACQDDGNLVLYAGPKAIWDTNGSVRVDKPALLTEIRDLEALDLSYNNFDLLRSVNFFFQREGLKSKLREQKVEAFSLSGKPDGEKVTITDSDTEKVVISDSEPTRMGKPFASHRVSGLKGGEQKFERKVSLTHSVISFGTLTLEAAAKGEVTAGPKAMVGAVGFSAEVRAKIEVGLNLKIDETVEEMCCTTINGSVTPNADIDYYHRYRKVIVTGSDGTRSELLVRVGVEVVVREK